MLCGEIINGFVKFDSSELVSIIMPFNSIIAIMLEEFSSPEMVVKLLFLSAKNVKDREIIIIMVKIDKKKAIDFMKTLKKIDIFSDL